MNISEQEQDIKLQDSVKQKPDTSVQKQAIQADTIRIQDSLPKKKREIRPVIEIPEIADTTSVSERSHIADITFYDSANVITRIGSDQINGFPFLFIRKNKQNETESLTRLMSELKDGKEIPSRPFHADWIIFIVLIAGFFYASIRTFSRKLFPGVIRFFLFRGVGGPESRDTGELFHWQSTIINLISFLNIALFIYCVVYYYKALPATIDGILPWLIALGMVIIALTLRHICCLVTGMISGEKEVFDEYIMTIYQSYRYLAIIYFVLVILLSYTQIFAPGTLIMTGYISFVVLYLMRAIRLYLIFLKRKVSVLYLILYLCALEILPVAVLVRYFTGLI